MLLAIDIGNTNITCGIFRRSKIIKRFNIPSSRYSLKALRQYIGKAKIQDSIICSVVPSLTKIIARDLKRLVLGRIYILGKNIKVPIRNLYRKPEQVGQDRLVNAYAGIMLYGRPLIVVDFGTAVTFDVISGNRDYLGGLILPGLRISLEALSEKTALLPKLKLNKPKDLIGADTKSSMLSGIVYGFAALTDDLASRIKAKIGRSAKVIATGGNIKLIGRYCKKIDAIDEKLTLKGLAMIYSQKNS